MVRLITTTNSEYEFAAVCIRETGLYLCYEGKPTEDSTPDTIFTANNIELVHPDETVDEVPRLLDVEGDESIGVSVDTMKPMRETRVVLDCWVR